MIFYDKKNKNRLVIIGYLLLLRDYTPSATFGEVYCLAICTLIFIDDDTKRKGILIHPVNCLRPL